MALRDFLKEELDMYFLYTFSYIKTVKDFIISRSSEWISHREAESEKMRRVKEQSTEGAAESGYRNEAELEIGLKETRIGLMEMQIFFLDAVEMLAATSAHVFKQNQVLQLPEGADLNSVHKIIYVSQLLCPLLLSFKRDNEAFFKPKLENIEVIKFQLNLYITNIKRMCDGFRNSFPDDLCLDNITIALNDDVSDDDIEKMLSNINKLNEYRMDEHVRLLCLFQDNHQTFMEKFRESEGRMLQVLSHLEACAVQLDSMNKGAKISSVVGSSVGLISGILSIVGLVLVPVTAGLSLGLVGAGATLAGLSGVNSVVTAATEAGVSHKQKKKANESFEKFMADVNAIQSSLNEVITKHFFKHQENQALKELISGSRVSAVSRNFDTIVDCYSAYSMTKMASELPELGQAAAKGPLAMSRAARGGFIALNAVFIGVDLFVIVKDSIALSKGSETEMSKCLRATAALWESEIISWQKMARSLEKGSKDPEKKLFILNEPFY